LTIFTEPYRGTSLIRNADGDIARARNLAGLLGGDGSATVLKQFTCVGRSSST